MTTATQHISPNPALDFANGILEETNGALELIEILRDIADGVDEKATTNDRIAANIVLADRGLGKCPKQVSPSPGPSPDPDSSASSESPSVVPHNEPESPRIVTQIDNSLHDQSIGPAPSSQRPPIIPARSLPSSLPTRGRESRVLLISSRLRRARYSRVPGAFQPLLYPSHYSTAYSRHHQQRPDDSAQPARNRQGRRRPEGLS